MRDEFHHRVLSRSFDRRLKHATLDRISVAADNLEAAKVKAKSLFETLDMPQKPDGLRILVQEERDGKRGTLFGSIRFEVAGGPDAQRLMLEFPVRSVSVERLDPVRQIICCYWRRAHYGGRYLVFLCSGMQPPRAHSLCSVLF